MELCFQMSSQRRHYQVELAPNGEGGGPAKKAAVAMEPDSLAEFLDIAANYHFDFRK